MKKKSFLIILGVMFLLVLLIVLGSTIFSVNHVSLNFLSSHESIVDTDEQILNSSEINITGNIFFVNKKIIKEKIQTTYPEIRVVNIESVFPNKLRINVVQRTPLFAVSTNEGYAICDEYLGVIYISEGYTSTVNNAISLIGVNIENDIVLGMEIQSKDSEFIHNLAHVLKEWEDTTSILLGNIQQITLNSSKENQLMISMFSGTTILIENCQNNLSTKLNYAFTYYDTNEDAYNGGIIKVIESDDGVTRLVYIP